MHRTILFIYILPHRSGKDGCYPQLEDAFEARIKELGGMSISRTKESKVLGMDNPEAAKTAAALLGDWPILDDRMRELERENIKGNEAMNSRDYASAYELYLRCTKATIGEKCGAKYASNCALAALKLKKPQDALRHATGMLY
jgi:hypothetical protein